MLVSHFSSYRVMQVGLDECLHTQWVALQDRDTNLGELTSIVACKQAYFVLSFVLERHYLIH